jgi:hypothetical protein
MNTTKIFGTPKTVSQLPLGSLKIRALERCERLNRTGLLKTKLSLFCMAVSGHVKGMFKHD